MSAFRQRAAAAGESFWFLPAVLGFSAIVLAQLLITLDRHIDGKDFGAWGVLLYRVGASGSRDILGAIGGSMLGVAATAFSITISVLATASSTYGPRLVRNFMSDRGNQFVLGIFGSTFLYSLMVLRSIRSESNDGESFVPDIAVNVAVLLAVVDVAVLVYFIHHIASSIQVSTLSARVRDELVDVVDHLYPQEVMDDHVPKRSIANAESVLAVKAGFVVGVDEQALVSDACSGKYVVELRVGAGDHVIAGEILAVVSGGGDSCADEIRAAIVLGDTRTPKQDIDFAVQQLTEMAVRALSPSTNDPYTARNAIDELAVGLVPLAARPTPLLGRLDSDGEYRVTVTRPVVGDLIGRTFGAFRRYGLSDPLVVEAVAQLGERIGRTTIHPEIRRGVLEQLAALSRAYEAGERDEIDVAVGQARLDEASAVVRSSV
nr:DUF2254 domain-containing protein [Rhodococcus sp. (in: high G+C Gram-positive bacteria)]